MADPSKHGMVSPVTSQTWSSPSRHDKKKLNIPANMESMKSKKEEVDWEVTGKGPIGTRWIDINRGANLTLSTDLG